MNIFYSFLSIVFAVFTYIVAIENEASTKKAILLALFMMFFWPIVMTVVTVYLIVLKCKQNKANDALAEELESEVAAHGGEWSPIPDENVDEQETEEVEETAEESEAN